MKRIILISLSVLFVLLGHFSFSKPITANVAKVNLTPPLEMKYSLGGYGDRMSKPATGVHDSIWAKTVIINDGEKKFAVVTLDVLGLPPNVKPAVIKKLADKKWETKNIMLLPSHSHASLDMTALNDKNVLNSPQIGIYQPELLDFVVDRIAQSIKEADKDFNPVKIGTGATVLDEMNRNRRHDPAVDKNLTVTRIDLLNGKPLAILVNWTAHPTFMDENDMDVSAGWPGFLQSGLELQIGNGVLVMYYNGAQGDQAANRPEGDNHYAQAEKYGAKLAKAVHKVYSDIDVSPNATLGFGLQKINLPERKAHPSFMETGGAEYGMSEEVVKVVMEMMCPTETTVGVVKIGDLMIVGAPGELAAGLGLEVKAKLKNAGVKYPVIGGLANEWISYMLSAEQYNGDGGYEASVSFYGETLGSIIVEEMIKTASGIIE